MKLWNHVAPRRCCWWRGCSASTAGAQAPKTKTVELGSINFPTSAKPAAQAPFLTGVKALYNFEFDIAARRVPRDAEGRSRRSRSATGARR